MEAYEHAEKQVGHLDNYNVLVDVEDTTHYLKHSIVEAANDFIAHIGGSEVEIKEEDFTEWGTPEAAYKMAEFMEWDEDEASRFMNGYEDWPGFHEVSDIIWIGNTEEYSWLSDEYDIRFTEPGVPEKFQELLDMDHTDVEIVTSRGNYLSNYNVESALARRVADDLNVQRDIIKFHNPANGHKTGRRDPRPDILLDDNHDMLEKGLEEDQIQLVVSADHNKHRDIPGGTPTFSQSVDVVRKLGG